MTNINNYNYNDGFLLTDNINAVFNNDSKTRATSRFSESLIKSHRIFLRDVKYVDITRQKNINFNCLFG
jgi:hypothetical protein